MSMMRLMVVVMVTLGWLTGCQAGSQDSPYDSQSSSDDVRGTFREMSNTRDEWSVLVDQRNVVLPPSLGGPQDDNDQEDYVTDILTYAGCEAGATTMNVAAQHFQPAECESIRLTPARNQDGDFYEVYGVFDWISSDPAVVTLMIQGGKKHNIVVPMGEQDLFEAQSLSEPQALLTACVHNTCPNPPPADCLDDVCTSIEVTSVINLEGAWLFSGTTFDEPATLSFWQEGRELRDDAHIKRGEINGQSVMITLGDYRYEGEIAPDQFHLQGVVHDLLNDTFIGNWSADALLP